nr:ribonuclease H-like domain-containing protein [Tanacetum cinerariifolium]
MTGNRSHLTDYKEINGGFVAFGGNSKGGKIVRKGKIRTGKLDFEDVYFVKELKFNLFSVSQMCDKKNSVLFIDTACVVLSPDIKLTDESHVLLKVPRKDNIRENNIELLVRPKQSVQSANHYMDLFGPTFVKSLMKKMYCQVVTNDFTYSSTSSSSSTNSEVSNDSNCYLSYLKCVKDLKEQNEQLVKDLRTARVSAVSCKTGLESVEATMLVFKKNKSVHVEDIKILKRDIYLRDLDITELKRKLELATKEKDEVQLTVQNFKNSSSLSKLLDSQILDKCKTGLGYNDVPPPYTGNFMPPKPDLLYLSLDDFVDESVVEKPTVDSNEPKTIRK